MFYDFIYLAKGFRVTKGTINLNILFMPCTFIFLHGWIFMPECIIIEPQRDKTIEMTYVPSEESDQSVHFPSLIRVFAVRMKKH